jgi:hypothetical protein
MKRKINFIKTFILVIMGGFLMAFTEENKGKAKLVFLHERAFWGSKVEVKINGQKVIDLSNNRYFEIEVDAENIDIIIDRGSSTTQDVHTNLTPEPDKIYYLKIYREADYFTDKLYLVRISEQTAKQVMKSMKLEKIPLKNE